VKDKDFKFLNGPDREETDPKEGDIYFNAERRFPWIFKRLYTYKFENNKWIEL